MIMRARKTNKKMRMTISVIVVKNCCMNDKKLNATALLDYKRTLSRCKCVTNVNAKFHPRNSFSLKNGRNWEFSRIVSFAPKLDFPVKLNLYCGLRTQILALSQQHSKSIYFRLWLEYKYKHKFRFRYRFSCNLDHLKSE